MASAPCVVMLVIIAIAGGASAQLSTGFYSNSCPGALGAVKSAVAKEPRMGASILRLFFHDCFVQGCDGSLLLDDTASLQGEKTAKPNNGSVRGFEVIDAVKAAVEKLCPGVVSCADVLAVAGRDSVVALGGPSWEVKVGRQDSTTASFSGIPCSLKPTRAPTSGLANLTALFAAQGLSQKDMVALSGSHTIGQARCTNFRAHIYNDTDIDNGFSATLQAGCPPTSGSGDNNLAPLDLQTPTTFENNYYKNLVGYQSLFYSRKKMYMLLSYPDVIGSTRGGRYTRCGSQRRRDTIKPPDWVEDYEDTAVGCSTCHVRVETTTHGFCSSARPPGSIVQVCAP